MKYKNKNKNKTKQSKKKNKQKKTTNVQTNKKEELNKTSEIQKKPNANEHIMWIFLVPMNRIGDVMDTVLAPSVIYRGFEPLSGQTKDYKIGICCFSAKHTTLRRKSKDLLAQNQDNVSEWSDMSTHWLLLMCPSGVTCLPTDCCFSEIAP